MKEKRIELRNSIVRLDTGLKRLIEANVEVEDMKVKLTDM